MVRADKSIGNGLKWLEMKQDIKKFIKIHRKIQKIVGRLLMTLAGSAILWYLFEMDGFMGILKFLIMLSVPVAALIGLSLAIDDDKKEQNSDIY